MFIFFVFISYLLVQWQFIFQLHIELTSMKYVFIGWYTLDKSILNCVLKLSACIFNNSGPYMNIVIHELKRASVKRAFITIWSMDLFFVRQFPNLPLTAYILYIINSGNGLHKANKMKNLRHCFMLGEIIGERLLLLQGFFLYCINY